MNIRWKLFLSLFLLTSFVSLALLICVEKEFQGWVSQQVADNFSNRVGALLSERNTRLDGVRQIAGKLASEEIVKSTLRGSFAPSQRKALMDSYERIRNEESDNIQTEPRAIGDSSIQAPLMGVVGLDGDFQFFGRAVTRRIGGNRKSAVTQLERTHAGNEQTISYVVISDDSGSDHVREVVVTPVNQGGRALGWFFLGMNAETNIDRTFQKLENASARGIRSGLVVGGEWFVEGMDPEILRKFTADIDDNFWTDGIPAVAEAGGNEYLLIAHDLNPGSPLEKGYQIGIYPLSDLTETITRLRWVVAGMALAALFLTVPVAVFLARRFSRPIDELIKGTIRVRGGDFQSEVRVQSKDEFGMLAASFNVMMRDLGLKEKYHDLLGKTSDPGLLKGLLEGRRELGGEIRQAAVLFCDIRGFTAMTDGMDPAEVIEMLNGHMTAMTKVIHDHGGVVDKFVGDLVMAVFGVPDARREILRGRSTARSRCSVSVSD